MLEPKTDATLLCCPQCSHRAVWSFELDHHIQRKHKNVYAAELFHAGIEPEEHSCLCCDSKNSTSLGRHEHCIIRHFVANNAEIKVTEDGHGSHEEFKLWTCNYCEYEGHSSVSLAKHHDSCEMVPKVPTADTTLLDAATSPGTNSTDTKAVNVIDQRGAQSKMDKNFQCVHCPYKYTGKCKYRLKRHMLSQHAKDADAMRARNLKLVASSKMKKFQCAHCTFRGKDKYTLKRHVLTHAKEEEITWSTCSKCSFRSRRKETLTRHSMLQHAADGEIDWYYCTVCSYRAKRKDTWKRHMLSRHPAADCTKVPYPAKDKENSRKTVAQSVTADEINWLYCANCSFRTETKGELVKHMANHMLPQLPAADCTKLTSSEKENGHKVAAQPDTVHGFDLLYCANCSFQTRTKGELEKHMENHKLPQHPAADCTKLTSPVKDNENTSHKLLVAQSVTVNDTNWLYCADCSYRTRIKGALTKHMSVHAAPSFCCTLCSYRGKRMPNLKNHMLVHAAADEITWINCTKCDFRTKTKNELKSHMLMHAAPEEITWFSCDVCSFRTKKIGKLNLHKRVRHATGDKIDWIKCEKCPYLAKTKLYLKRHMVQHADEADWFSCNECSYRTKREVNLKTHKLKVHAAADEVTWFNCTKCSYRSIKKAYTTKHELTHAAADEINWLYCAKCPSRCRTKSALKTHMLQRHASADDDKWMTCTECTYRTIRKENLTMHQLTHAKDDEIEWFHCDKCPYRAKQRRYLKNHVKLMHNKTGSVKAMKSQDLLSAQDVEAAKTESDEKAHVQTSCSSSNQQSVPES